MGSTTVRRRGLSHLPAQRFADQTLDLAAA
jgi:hypothetical protein